MEDEEDGEKGEKSGNEDKDGELFGPAGIVAKFTKQFGWIHSAVKVRETLGYDIDRVFELNIIEFLNWLSYIKSYNSMNEALRNEQENKGKKYY